MRFEISDLSWPVITGRAVEFHAERFGDGDGSAHWEEGCQLAWWVERGLGGGGGRGVSRHRAGHAGGDHGEPFKHGAYWWRMEGT